jgi:hypothetical protein
VKNVVNEIVDKIMLTSMTKNIIDILINRSMVGVLERARTKRLERKEVKI